MNGTNDLVGTWRLKSRIDRDQDGEQVEEPTLGSDPEALLFFDAAGNFAAQFMKRDRSGNVETPEVSAPNNTTAVGGYDAYFGTYELDPGSGSVTTRMVAALSPTNVGMTATRRMMVEDDRLTIELDTSASDGSPVRRTLTWERVG